MKLRCILIIHEFLGTEQQAGTSTGGPTLHGTGLARQRISQETQPSFSISEMFRQKRTREQIPEEQGQEENEVEEPPAKMRRFGVRFNWPANPEMTFGSKDECEAFIASEKTWKFIRNRGTKDGFRGEYQCDKVKARGENCAAGICTRFGKGHGDAAYDIFIVFQMLTITTN